MCSTAKLLTLESALTVTQTVCRKNWLYVIAMYCTLIIFIIHLTKKLFRHSLLQIITGRMTEPADFHFKVLHKLYSNTAAFAFTSRNTRPRYSLIKIFGRSYQFHTGLYCNPGRTVIHPLALYGRNDRLPSKYLVCLHETVGSQEYPL